MSEAYLVDAVRTPVGKKGGALAQVHPADLGAHVLTNLVARTQIDPAAVEDVIFGCVDSIGPQAGAIDERRFEREIAPVGELRHDEGPRRGTSLEKMAALQPLADNGRITAAVASQISDGAAALLVASERALKTHNLRPRARIHHLS